MEGSGGRRWGKRGGDADLGHVGGGGEAGEMPDGEAEFGGGGGGKGGRLTWWICGEVVLVHGCWGWEALVGSSGLLVLGVGGRGGSVLFLCPHWGVGE